MTKQIPLTQGKFALVDNDVYDGLNKHKWYARKGKKTYYARRNVWNGKEQVAILMHRQILGLYYRDGKITDHKNRNGLDNRRENLRVVSNMENMHNHGGHTRNMSGYNGVFWDKRRNKWRAQIGVNGKPVYLGIYNNIKDAIEARRQGELAYW